MRKLGPTSRNLNRLTAKPVLSSLCELHIQRMSCTFSCVFRTYNDPGEGKNFVNGTGAVDIYGLVSSIQGCVAPWAPSRSLLSRTLTRKASTAPTRTCGAPSSRTTIRITRRPTQENHGICLSSKVRQRLVKLCEYALPDVQKVVPSIHGAAPDTMPARR